MLYSGHIKKLLDRILEPVKTPLSTYELQSAVLLSAKTGSIISFASNSPQKPINNDSINNLKMMALLIREKWLEDEQDPDAQSTKSCYTISIEPNTSETNQILQPYTTHIYTCGLEDLHTCVAQVPDSDLLLLFIANSSVPYGLLVIKMKNVLPAFRDIFGYKLD